MIRRAALAAAALAAAQAAAQQPVVPPSADPGAIQQRQIEEERRRREAERERLKAIEPIKRDALEQPAAKPAPESVRFLVREIQFTPSEILSAAELEAIARDYRGRQLSLADLQKLAERVNALYKSKNVVTAQAVVPPQDVSDGVVRIRLIEGKLGKLRIEGNASTREGYIAGRLRLKPAELIDLSRLEQSLTRFNRTNDAQLRAELKPGADFATTDVIVGVTEPPRQELRLTLDDFGAPSTGRWREGVTYLNRSVLGFRDDLSLSVTQADGQFSRAYSYGFPFNPWGGRISLAYYKDETAIKHGPLETLKITGLSQAQVLTIRQPLYVGAHAQLDALGGGKRRFSSNWIDTVFLQRTETHDANLGLELQAFDDKSFWLASYTLSAGRAKVLAETDYGIGRGALRYSRELGRGFSLRGNLSWQTTRQQGLPSSEQFFIGGEGSVRGYTVGTYVGDTGQTLSLELHHPLWKRESQGRETSLTGFFFTDYGAVKPFLPPNSTLNPNPHLSSVGWGLNAAFGKHVYGRLTFGYGITDVPGAPRHYDVLFQLVASAF